MLGTSLPPWDVPGGPRALLVPKDLSGTPLGCVGRQDPQVTHVQQADGSFLLLSAHPDTDMSKPLFLLLTGDRAVDYSLIEKFTVTYNADGTMKVTLHHEGHDGRCKRRLVSVQGGAFSMSIPWGF